MNKRENWRHGDVVLTALLDSAAAKAATRAAAAGDLVRIREGVYLPASVPEGDRPAMLARRSLDLAAALAPGAVVTGVSALAGGMVEGSLFLAYKYPRVIELPGVTLRLVEGNGAVAGDMPYKDARLHFAGRARTFLENLIPARGQPPRSAGKAAVAARLEQVLQNQGEAELNRVREEAKSVAPLLDLATEMKALDMMISNILATGPAVRRKNPALVGKPVDGARMELFGVLAQNLRSREMPTVGSVAEGATERRNQAFIESYFSNYIEGTEFLIDEAIDIAIRGNLPRLRPKDAHDILGVMALAENPIDRGATLPRGLAILSTLEEAHRRMLAQRPEATPGVFKSDPNRAGNTAFVLPELARGTLIEASELLSTVPEGLARGIFAGFLVAEVHPFADGNGRLSRLMMNAELTTRGLQRIVIPTLARDEYLDCLRALSRAREPKPITDFMIKMQAWSAAFDYLDLALAIEQIRSTNAFEKSLNQHRLLNLVDIASEDARVESTRNRPG